MMKRRVWSQPEISHLSLKAKGLVLGCKLEKMEERMELFQEPKQVGGGGNGQDWRGLARV